MALGAQVRDDIAILVQVHVGGSGKRGLFAEVDKGLAAIGQLDGHETAAAQVTGCGIHHRQRITDCNRSIDGVTAILEHIDADVSGQVLGRHDHAVLGGDRCL